MGRAALDHATKGEKEKITKSVPIDRVILYPIEVYSKGYLLGIRQKGHMLSAS